MGIFKSFFSSLLHLNKISIFLTILGSSSAVAFNLKLSCLFIIEIFAFTSVVSPTQFLFQRVSNYTTLYCMRTKPCKLLIQLLQ